jgi:hypothetical protein
MKLGLSVHGTDGKKRLAVVAFPDFVKYEEIHNVSMAKVEAEMKVRDLAWLAWHSEKRNKVTALDFDAWLETVEQITGSEGEDRIVPLESTQPTG